MKFRKSNMIFSWLMLFFLSGIGLCIWLKQPAAYSMAERRPLAGRPVFDGGNVLKQKYMSDFETYELDQFPLRDSFRTIKAVAEYKFFGKKDNNGIYFRKGHLSRLEYPMREDMMDYAAERFTYLYDTYLREKGIQPYFAIIPDKNAYLTGQNDMISLNYDGFYAKMQNKVPYMKYIAINNLISLEDYYRSDTHWKQECILGVAERIGKSMEVNVQAEYEICKLEMPFQGVYAGQAAIPVEPDTINYLKNEMLDHCIVTNYDSGTGKKGVLYDLQKAKGKDPYEMFLMGASPLITIENEQAETNKELVIFRDSFGSSLAPLLLPGYRKITLVDIRYMNSELIGNYVEFENQDVLFLYSTLLLNQSLALR